MSWFARLRVGMTVVHQRMTDLPGMDAHRIETRYRCIESRHEGRLYNTDVDATWCMCGRVIRPGDHGRWDTAAELEEKYPGHAERRRWQEGRHASLPAGSGVKS